MKKHFLTAALTAAVGLALTFPAEAGWKGSYEEGWKYVREDNTVPQNQWEKIDNVLYYFGNDSFLLTDAVTPDGYYVGADGAWDPSVPRAAWKTDENGVDIELMRYYDSSYSANNIYSYDRTALEQKLAQSCFYNSHDGILIKDYLYLTSLRDYKADGTPLPIGSDPMLHDQFDKVLLRIPVDKGTLGDVEILNTWGPWNLKVTEAVGLSGQITHAAQGKLCLAFNSPNGPCYYQYDLTDGTLNQVSSKEDNESLKVAGRYCEDDYLYYDVKTSNDLSCSVTIRNYKNEVIRNLNFNISFPELNKEGNYYKTPSYIRTEQDKMRFHITVLSGIYGKGKYLSYGSFGSDIPAGTKSKSYTLYYDKYTGALVHYE